MPSDAIIHFEAHGADLRVFADGTFLVHGIVGQRLEPMEIPLVIKHLPLVFVVPHPPIRHVREIAQVLRLPTLRISRTPTATPAITRVKRVREREVTGHGFES